MRQAILLIGPIIWTISFPASPPELNVTPTGEPEDIQQEPASDPIAVPFAELSLEPVVELGDADPDLSVRAWLTAANDGFFFYAGVTDDVFENTYWGDDLWRGDSIQIAIDPLHNRTPGRYGHDDHEIGLALVEKKPLVWRFQAPHYLDRGIVPGAKLTVKRKGNHTAYDLYLPYESVGYLSPAVFPYCGFTFAVNDSDTRGKRDGVLAWTSGIADTKNPAAFRTLRWPTKELLSESSGASAWVQQGERFAPVGEPHHFTLTVRSDESRRLFIGAAVGGKRVKTELSVPGGPSWYDLALRTDGETSARLMVKFNFIGEPLGEFVVFRYEQR